MINREYNLIDFEQPERKMTIKIDEDGNIVELKDKTIIIYNESDYIIEKSKT